MNFKQATDVLFDGIDHADLAETLNVSVAAVRQARLRPTAKAHRNPPKGWQRAIVQLARERVAHLRKLIGEIKTSPGSSD